MIRDLDFPVFGNCERVLVCITAQSNSKRLISTAAEVADKNNAELHILHVQKGDSIFLNDEAPLLLERLFEYGKNKGGMVHMYCDNNVPKSICEFIKSRGITRLVLGEPPENIKANKKKAENQLDAILNSIGSGVELIIVSRDADKIATA